MLAPSAGGHYPVRAANSELPDDVVRMIWAMRWRADAAEMVQRAVRRTIRRAGGLPWDLPSLVTSTDYSDAHASWYETRLGSASEYARRLQYHG